MGHRKSHAPRRGSMAYYPRVRVKKVIPRVRSWPEVSLSSPKLLAYPCYKAGVTHAIATDIKHTSPLAGRDIVITSSILDAPPIFVCGYRAYVKDSLGYLKTLTEVWSEKIPNYIDRVLTISNEYKEDIIKNAEKRKKIIAENLNKIAEFRVIASTQPYLIGLKKKPELVEIKIGGGAIDAQYNYCLQIVGNEIYPKQIISEGQYVDVISITKGKGYQGVVKRFGVKILPRKSRKGRRDIGAIGPAAPSMLFYIPRSGQMGFHQRTEFNKLVLKIGDNGYEVTPKGGFLHYGIVKGHYIILKGSIPGSTKRLVILRHPIRPPKTTSQLKLVTVNTDSKQG
ncbi:MAG: 50S ribosomal protein L3 [Candidatus Methanomethylicia archaeon]